MARYSLKSLVRQAMGDRAYGSLVNRKNNAKSLLHYLVARYVRRAPHLGYDRAYYAESDEQYGHSFAVMAKSLQQRYQPKRVIDIGCGSGAFGLALMREGVAEVYGYDQSADAVSLAQEHGLTSAEVLDVTVANSAGATGDLCTSFEVAEHVPGRYAHRFCALLAAAAPAVVMTAAPPGQGGYLHVNEQPTAYWIDHMRTCGMAFDAETTAELKSAWAGRVAAHYHDNLLAFRAMPGTK